ncbi:MAG: exodeoxyribonuclease III [Acidimicrobiales bacterium]
MRIATWNVNSLKARLPKVVRWLDYAQPDVLCMQETKLDDAAFPVMAFGDLGYEVAFHGQGRWNGVAIASRVGLRDVRTGFVDHNAGLPEEARMVTASCGGVQVSSVYVPNGRSIEDDQYQYKLRWLEHLGGELARHGDPDEPLAICGDFNIAPEDRDVFDPTRFVGATHTSQPERAALQQMLAWGMADSFRLVYPDTGDLFTWWDYRSGDFHKHRGMRIDLILVSRRLVPQVRWALVDREARKGLGSPEPPSDHAPLVVDLDAGSAEIGPASG